MKTCKGNSTYKNVKRVDSYKELYSKKIIGKVNNNHRFKDFAGEKPATNLQKIKKYYEEYDCGKLKDKEMETKLAKELQVDKEKVTKVLSSSKNKNFRSFVMNLNILKNQQPNAMPKYSSSQIRTSTDFNYHRRKKNEPSKVFNSLGHKKTNSLNILKESVDSFAKGELDAKSFKQVLTENDVNPDTGIISKHIRASSVSGMIQHNQLLSSVLRDKKNSKRFLDLARDDDKWPTTPNKERVSRRRLIRDNTNNNAEVPYKQRKQSNHNHSVSKIFEGETHNRKISDMSYGIVRSDYRENEGIFDQEMHRTSKSSSYMFKPRKFF